MPTQPIKLDDSAGSTLLNKKTKRNKLSKKNVLKRLIKAELCVKMAVHSFLLYALLNVEHDV